MKKTSTKAIVLHVLFLLTIMISPARICAQSGSQPDIVLRFGSVETILNTADKLSGADSSGISPGVLARGFFYGTDWIDPRRSIVIGVFFSEDKPFSEADVLGLIPFIKENDDFQSSYQAVKRGNYYLVPMPLMPLDSKTEGADQQENKLMEFMKRPPEGLITCEVSTSQVLDKAEEQIQQAFADIVKTAEESYTDASASQMTPETLDLILENLLETSKDLEKFTAGLDLAGSDLSLILQLIARPGSDTFNVILESCDDAPASVLGKYMPDPGYQVHLRTLPFDNSAALSFFDENFGPLYQSMGIDLRRFDEITRFFSGEMSGGFSFDPSGIEMEMLFPAKSGESIPSDYITSEYIPWMMDYGRKSLEFYSVAGDPASIFVRCDDSVVSGEKVAGLEGKLPMDIDSQGNPVLVPFEMRMAVVNDFMIVASDDRKMKRLIQHSKQHKPAPVAGPLMEMTLDLKNFSKVITDLSGTGSGMGSPSLGKLRYTLDVDGGVVSSRYTVNLDDVRTFSDYVSTADHKTGAQQEASFKIDDASRTSLENTGMSPRQESNRDKGVGYWLDKGALFATYGNQDAAIRAFKNVIELDSDNSEAYFNLGVAYGEKGEFQNAIIAVNRAIAAEPENGRFRYGRGWLYQLSGEKEKAMADIQKAAEFGNAEALNYLENIVPRQSL